jgi:peptide/nickel transport system substrate-binding protein
VGDRFPDNAFKQNLANTFMDVISSAYAINNLGAWNGNLYDTSKYMQSPTAVSTRITGRKAPALQYPGTGCLVYPDWWMDWARFGAAQKSLDPVDQPLQPNRYCGTGPYYVQTINSVAGQVILQRNPGYWRGWPATDPYGNPCGDPASPPNIPTATNGYVDTVNIAYIASDATRASLLNSGALDTAIIPMSALPLMVGSNGLPLVPSVKTIQRVAPELMLDANMFTFVINPASPYIGTGSLPTGIPTNFFSNTNVRKAFAYSFSQTQYITNALFGAAQVNRVNPFVEGLYPDYYNWASSGYNMNYLAAFTCLTSATFTVGGVTKSLWQWGFTFTLPYNTGNSARQTACTEIQTFFTTLQTMFGTGPFGPAGTFTINLVPISWNTFITDFYAQNLPMFDVRWLADFADADDFVRAYMHSNGFFASLQGYTAANGGSTQKDALIDQALFTDDSAGLGSPGYMARQALYNQLQQIYYNDCPSFTVATPTGGHWCNYWVKGWYYDALYPGEHAYTIWKQDTPWYDVSGSTVGVSDGKINMKDIAYLVVHFNAKAPTSTVLDPKWVGVYGANGCVDPYGDRVSNMKDIAGTVARFNMNAPGNDP